MRSLGGNMQQIHTAGSAQAGGEGAIAFANPLPFRAYGYQKVFIDEYLRMRIYDLTDDNRAIVAEGIDKYEGGEVVMPGELVTFLDNLFRVNRF
jgi:hypothetical protein